MLHEACSYLGFGIYPTLSLYLAGEWWFLGILIGSFILEYPELLTLEQNKIAFHFVSVAEEENCFE